MVTEPSCAVADHPDSRRLVKQTAESGRDQPEVGGLREIAERQFGAS
jgi:hypothetical protein